MPMYIENRVYCKCGEEFTYESKDIHTECIKTSTIADMADGYDTYFVIEYVYCPYCDRYIKINDYQKKIGYMKEIEDDFS